MYIEKMLEFLRNFSTQLACKFFTLTFVGFVHQRIVCSKHCVLCNDGSSRKNYWKEVHNSTWVISRWWLKQIFATLSHLPLSFSYFTSAKLCFWTLRLTAHSASTLIRPCGSLEQQQQSLRKLPQFFMLPLSNSGRCRKVQGENQSQGRFFTDIQQWSHRRHHLQQDVDGREEHTATLATSSHVGNYLGDIKISFLLDCFHWLPKYSVTYLISHFLCVTYLLTKKAPDYYLLISRLYFIQSNLTISSNFFSEEKRS